MTILVGITCAPSFEYFIYIVNPLLYYNLLCVSPCITPVAVRTPSSVNIHSHSCTFLQIILYSRHILALLYIALYICLRLAQFIVDQERSVSYAITVFFLNHFTWR